MAVKAKNVSLTFNGEPVPGVTEFQEAIIARVAHSAGVTPGLLGEDLPRAWSGLRETLQEEMTLQARRAASRPARVTARQVTLEMDVVHDPVAWARFVEEAHRLDAEKRCAAIRDVLRALVPAEELTDDYFDRITEHHFIVLPRRVVDEHPELGRFDFVRAHYMPCERVYVVDGKPYADLANFGTPAKYPHKVRED